MIMQAKCVSLEEDLTDEGAFPISHLLSNSCPICQKDHEKPVRNCSNHVWTYFYMDKTCITYTCERNSWFQIGFTESNSTISVLMRSAPNFRMNCCYQEELPLMTTKEEFAYQLSRRTELIALAKNNLLFL